MISRELSCCFTGHRPDKLPWGSCENDDRCKALKKEISLCAEELYNKGCRHFISGMAAGCDMYFAEVISELKTLHPDITLEAAVPCRNQARLWSRSMQEKYNALLKKCDICSILQEEYTSSCMALRNRYMINNSSHIIACFDGTYGGTMQTILQAKREGLDVITIDINKYK